MAGYKNLKRSRRDEEDDSDAEVSKPSKTTKKSKTAASASSAPESGKDDDGNTYWALSGKRRVNISEFKGSSYINIREYYADPKGDLKPTKKGISLSLEQYNAFLQVIPSINAELAAAGLEVAEIPSGDSIEAPSEPKKSSKKEPKKESKKSKKSNIEATSDEESEEDDD